MVLFEHRVSEEQLTLKLLLGSHPLRRDQTFGVLVAVGDGVVDPLVASDVGGLFSVEATEDIDLAIFGLGIFAGLKPARSSYFP